MPLLDLASFSKASRKTPSIESDGFSRNATFTIADATTVSSAIFISKLIEVIPFGSGAFHIDALVRATGLRREIVIRAAKELMHRRLIAPGGPGLLTSYDEEAARKLREWAEKWCAGDDGCGVGK